MKLKVKVAVEWKKERSLLQELSRLYPHCQEGDAISSRQYLLTFLPICFPSYGWVFKPSLLLCNVLTLDVQEPSEFFIHLHSLHRFWCRLNGSFVSKWCFTFLIFGFLLFQCNSYKSCTSGFYNWYKMHCFSPKNKIPCNYHYAWSWCLMVHPKINI